MFNIRGQITTFNTCAHGGQSRISFSLTWAIVKQYVLNHIGGHWLLVFTLLVAFKIKGQFNQI